MDANLMHISYESGILENPATAPPADLFILTDDPRRVHQHTLSLEIGFLKGLPVFIKTADFDINDSLEMFNFLNKIGGRYGIGRIDIVENRYIGLKVRV